MLKSNHSTDDKRQTNGHIYSDFMKNKSTPQSLDTVSPKTLRSDASLHLIWLNSFRRVLDCIIVIQIAPFA